MICIEHLADLLAETPAGVSVLADQIPSADGVLNGTSLCLAHLVAATGATIGREHAHVV